MRKLNIFISIYIFTGMFACQTHGQNPAKHQGTQTNTTIFADDFSSYPAGSSPTQWNCNTKAEVVKYPGYAQNWLKLYAHGTYLPIVKSMPKNFDILFDYIHLVNGPGNNSTEITFFSQKENSGLDADFPGKAGVKIYLADDVVSFLSYNNNNVLDKSTGENRNLLITNNKIAKVCIEVRTKSITLKLNDNQIFNITTDQNLAQPVTNLRFNLWGSVAEPLIGDFRIIER